MANDNPNSISDTLAELEVYGSLFDKLSGITSEREHVGSTMHHMDLYDGLRDGDFGEGASKSEIEKAMVDAFEKLALVFEEAVGARTGESTTSSDGYQDEIESLDEMRSALDDFGEFFEELPKKLNTDNDELTMAISRVGNSVQELIGAVSKTRGLIENILDASRDSY